MNDKHSTNDDQSYMHDDSVMFMWLDFYKKVENKEDREKILRDIENTFNRNDQEILRLLKGESEASLTIDEIAQKCGVASDYVRGVQDGYFKKIKDFLYPENEKQIMREQGIKCMDKVISTFKDLHDQEILKLRFGKEEGMSYTLEELCKKFNVTREYIRQIESIAVEKFSKIVDNDKS